jgi:hypothetical protein
MAFKSVASVRRAAVTKGETDAGKADCWAVDVLK